MKHFAGPVWWIAPLLFPIEIISHCARVMSLTIRLYANMFASDLVTLVFFSLVPLAIPALFLGLHFFVSLIQAYVFMLLAMIYLSAGRCARALEPSHRLKDRAKIPPESASAPEQSDGCKREGASTVSLNHPLAANLQGSRRNMRKLQSVFMALAAPLLRRPGICGRRFGSDQPCPDRRRHRHGNGCGSVRPRSGQSHRLCH